MNRIAVTSTLLLIGASLLSACANSEHGTTTALIDGNKDAGPASAYATTSQTQSNTTTGFNPFTDHTNQAHSGPRKVLTNPSLADVMKTGPLPERFQGRADAPVTVVKYASLTCPICRRFMKNVYPQFKREYIDTGKVRFVIREFPIGRASGNATVALRCAPADKYFTLYAKFLAQQPKWVSQEVRLDAIYSVASQVGMTRPQFDACLKNQAMIDGLKWVKDRGRTLGIIGTPNFFIQEKLIKSTLDMKALRQNIDPLLSAPVASARTGG